MLGFFSKKLFDLSFSLILLFFLSPIFLFVSIIIFFSMGRPVFFRQERAGFKGKPFLIIKFRTMKVETHDENGGRIDPAERITKLGEFLRQTSLDELPQLINVLKGEMSLVGPRPLPIEYLDYYSDYHSLRHEVKPGITGLAQIKGRQELKFSQRLDLDICYVEKRNLYLDIKIILKTVKKVIKGSGVKNKQKIQEIDDIGFQNAFKEERENADN